jgi:pimeloyl-ACP methyl ester carboxylesterase
MLTPWVSQGALIGYARIVAAPKNVWLMLHGNGEQASDRGYALPCFSPDDAVFILEYPGYGERKGVPSQESLDRAARDGYLLLRQTYPRLPVCVVGESLGTGVASSLADLSPAPDKIVLIVPFDRLSLVAEDHFPDFLVPLILTDNWDNVAALSHYRGPLDIFGAEDDRVIPVAHAKALAAALPSARFFLIPGGHNGWSRDQRVRITNP